MLLWVSEAISAEVSVFPHSSYMAPTLGHYRVHIHPHGEERATQVVHNPRATTPLPHPERYSKWRA
ncbi:hypothetical protein CCICO_00755 [Corynebacterium ciconiae DSM 44920]|nr:hypothetical protein CCICO_00755 [Corynebacterium ciconiae DSM 44920]